MSAVSEPLFDYAEKSLGALGNFLHMLPFSLSKVALSWSVLYRRRRMG